MSKVHEFLIVTKDKKCEQVTLEQLIARGCNNIMEYLRFTGFKDADKQKVYEGSVIELMITDELLDHSKNTFYNSNLGKAMSKDRSIKSVLCEIASDQEQLHCKYTVYFVTDDGVMMDDNGAIEEQALGYDTMFPAYLCAKGGRVIGNTVIDNDIYKKIDNYTNWASKETEIHVIVENCDDNEVEYTWVNLAELRRAWFSEECNVPMLDDVLVEANVFGKKVEGDTFKDFIYKLETKTGCKILGAEEKFKVKVINCIDDIEEWEWHTLEDLKHDYSVADVLALPNDFDKVVKAYINDKEIKVDTFGEYIQYIKDTIGW